MDIEACTEAEYNWMLYRYSDHHDGMIFRRLNENCSDFDEAIISETPYGWVCIDQKNRFIDVVDGMKEAFIWLQDI